MRVQTMSRILLTVLLLALLVPTYYYWSIGMLKLGWLLALILVLGVILTWIPWDKMRRSQ